jgi:Ca2+-binding EF-hand superfamily protein
MMGPGMMGPGMGPGMMRPGMGRNMPGFGAFDRNDDGRVSEQEFQQTRAERQRQRSQQGYPMRGAAYAPSFSDLDADGSGGISPDEFARFHGAARRR